MARVLLVGKGRPDTGGIPVFLETLLASELATRHDVAFLNVARGGTTEGGRVSAGNLRRTAGDAWAVWRRSRRTDVVHVHSALGATPTVLRAGALAAAARLRGAVPVVHAHGGALPLWMTSARRRRLVRVALAPAARVVAVSEGGLASLRSALPGGKVLLVDNGVDVAAFAPPAGGRPRGDGRPRVLFAGGLTERKGLLDLFEASRLLDTAGVPHELAVAGGTPDEGPAAEAVVRAAAPPAARLLGRVPHGAMPALYASADVFCLPSWWEAAPLSLLEAMACGVPVVATRVGDVARLAPEGTGLLVDPRRPADLAAALERLLLDPGLRDRMGRAGRDHVAARFSTAVTVRSILSLYDDVLGERARRPLGGP